MSDQGRFVPAFGRFSRNDAERMPPPPPPPPNQRFAPAFSRRSRGPSTSSTDSHSMSTVHSHDQSASNRGSSQSSQRTFAPAFGRRPPQSSHEDDAFSSEQFEYMVAPSFDDIQPTWNTSDTSTQQRTQEQAGALHGPWDNYGHRADLDANEMFIDTANILDVQEGPRNRFEKLNADALAIKRNRSQVINMFGDKKVNTVQQKIDDRMKHLDDDGNYADGVDRGQVKKRYLEERQKRIQKRGEELLWFNKIKLEWNALSEMEKEARIQKSLENSKIMLSRLEFEEKEEIPEEYLQDFEDLTIHIPDQEDSDEEPLFMTGDEPDEDGIANLALVVELVEKGRTSSYQGSDIDSGGDFEKDRPPSKKSVKDFQYNRTVPASSRKNRRSTYARSQSSQQDSSRHQQTTSSSISKSIERAPKGPTASRAKSKSRNSTSYFIPKPLPEPSPASKNTFEVTTWPGLLPLYDLSNKEKPLKPEELSDSKVEKALKLSKGNGRVVIVSLVPGVEFSCEAIVQRVFGGLVQDIQFFPAERQAAITFLHTWAAAAYVVHNRCAREESVQDFRRLQVACAWYQDDEGSSLYQAQPQILVHALLRGGTRVLLIEHVDQNIKLQDLDAAFRVMFKDEVIVRCKLVRPRTRHKRAEANSNSVVLEFASIKAAYEVKTRFENGQVREFEDCDVSYLADPVQVPRASQPYCQCRYCNNLIDQSQLYNGQRSVRESSFQTVTSGVGSVQSSNDNTKLLRRLRDIRMEVRRREGEDDEALEERRREIKDEYDWEKDLRQPVGFDDRRYKERPTSSNLADSAPASSTRAESIFTEDSDDGQRP